MGAGAEAARVVSARERKRTAKKPRSSKRGGRSKKRFEVEVSQALEKLEDAGDPGPDMKPFDGRTKQRRLMRCPSCGAKISERAKECPKCGVAPWAECGICRARIRSGSSICPECGDPDPFNP